MILWAVVSWGVFALQAPACLTRAAVGQRWVLRERRLANGDINHLLKWKAGPGACGQAHQPHFW